MPVDTQRPAQLTRIASRPVAARKSAARGLVAERNDGRERVSLAGVRPLIVISYHLIKRPNLARDYHSTPAESRRRLGRALLSLRRPDSVFPPFSSPPLDHRPTARKSALLNTESAGGRRGRGTRLRRGIMILVKVSDALPQHARTPHTFHARPRASLDTPRRVSCASL